MFKQRLLIFILVFGVLVQPLAAAEDDIAVSLFSKYHPKRLFLEPAGAYMVNGEPGNGPLRIKIAGRGVEVNGQKYAEVYIDVDDLWLEGRINGQKQGVIFPARFRVHYYEKELAITGFVPREEYVAAVVQAEIGQGPPAALAAQAILARTYIAANAARHSQRRARLCDLTHCQVYRAGPPADWALAAARATAGMILVNKDGDPAQAFYSSTCGGRTVAPDVIWPGSDDSLVGIEDKLPGDVVPLCRLSPHQYWAASITKEELRPLLKTLTGHEIKGNYQVAVNQRVAGVVTGLRIRSGHNSYIVPEQRFHQLVGRQLGWQRLKSSTYELADSREVLFFAGRGLGHQVGLCQYGARALAKKGWNYKQILKHYFPKLKLRNIDNH